MIYYKDSSNKIYAFSGKKAYEKFGKVDKHGNKRNLVEVSHEESIAIKEASKTTEQRISEIKRRYNQAIQKVCIAHLFNDINSARNLATLMSSPLQSIAKQITDWELKNQKQFIDLFNAVENGKFTIESYTFDDNFQHFDDFVFD